ncbi:TetR/AcrR family transcriptional regulator [Mycobacterium intracellulare]|uniref:TetR/AcrR family transcriptional regulator n=1 Tax=Mycobacterium intracellulare TaxID=1767 RepID=UPI00192734A3|nr:TetR/AcrR family transcriptional regulator [Mycobacterium intracellulare]BCO66314.1 transcriptional regulator [Mycobacterium intracellulare]
MAPPTRNRQALLDAAIRCIQERGYARTTARDIVAVSNTNLGAIGYHFGSKEALMTEALAECCRRWLAAVSSAANQPGGSPWDNAVTAAYRAVEDSREVAVAYLEAWAQIERSPELREQLAGHYREFRTATAALIQSVIPRARSEHLDVEALSAILIAVFDGLMVQWLLDPDALPSLDRLGTTLTPLIEM